MSTQYRYPHFRRKILLEDMAFRGGPAPGRPMPDFDLPTTDGGRIRKGDFVGRRPLLLTLASITCPMALSDVPELKRLHVRFGDRVEFVTLYVREAHPGERYPQPDTIERKLAHATAYKERARIPWTVAVDDIEGELHRALDPRPHAAYLMDTDGTVAFRALNSNQERVLRKGIEDALFRQPPGLGENRSRAVPLAKGLGSMCEALDLAGKEAKRDIRRELGPVYLMAVLAGALRPLPPLGRGIAASAITSIGVMAACWRLLWLLRWGAWPRVARRAVPRRS
ncbi:MAG: hypothetical protein M3Q65_14510 [Chloroflexota bacterium]|nr:hypothetical protein [Chloroflexota bacterium]